MLRCDESVFQGMWHAIQPAGQHALAQRYMPKPRAWSHGHAAYLPLWIPPRTLIWLPPRDAATQHANCEHHDRSRNEGRHRDAPTETLQTHL